MIDLKRIEEINHKIDVFQNYYHKQLQKVKELTAEFVVNTENEVIKQAYIDAENRLIEFEREIQLLQDELSFFYNLGI